MEFGSLWSYIDANLGKVWSALTCSNFPMLRVSGSNISKMQIEVKASHLRSIRALQCITITEDTVHRICNLIKSMTNLQMVFLEIYGITSTIADIPFDTCRHIIKNLKVWSLCQG